MKFYRTRSSIAFGALSALGLLATTVSATAATLSSAAAADFDIENDFLPGVSGPTDVAVLPDGRVVVIERAGEVYTKPVGDGEPAQDHVDVMASHSEQGLLGVVADPDFATNQYIYFYASAGADAANRHQVQRYKLGADGKLTDKKIVVEMGLRGPANHNGGALDIYQGHLYIGVGDTGANNTPPTNKFSSCLNIANGKVLRVSLEEATLGQPVADNPLVNEAMVTGCDSTSGAFGMKAPEKRIFAWGFRNPFRLWVDHTNGNVWVGDVGETTREEVGVIRKGSHAGYPFVEGTTEYNQAFKPPNGGCMGMTPATACVAPVYDWPRAQRGSSTGGRILDGCGWPAAWKNRYIFGDHEQDKTWTIDLTDRTTMVADSLKEFASTSNVRAFRMGTDNALYIVEGNGVARVTAKGAMSTPGSCMTVDGPEAPVGGGGAGSGGSAGSPGSAGSAGSSNTSGAGNNAGASAGGSSAGGSSSTSGSSSGGASAGTSAGGNRPGAAGSGTASGAAGSPASGGSDDDGCGCRVAGAGSNSSLGLGALAALVLAVGRRRRAARSVE